MSDICAVTTITLLEAARDAQTAYWTAVRQLEESLGVDIDKARDLQSATIADLIGCSVCRKVFKTCVCGGLTMAELERGDRRQA